MYQKEIPNEVLENIYFSISAIFMSANGFIKFWNQNKTSQKYVRPLKVQIHSTKTSLPPEVNNAVT